MRLSLFAVVAVAVVAPALAACGGSSKPRLASRRATTTTTAAAADTSTTTTVAGAPGATPGGGTNAAGQPVTPTTVLGTGGQAGQSSVTAPAGPGADQPVTGTLDKKCVRRGVDQQGVTVHMTARQVVGYDTVYSDRSTEFSNKSYTTGYGYGKSDDNGVFRKTWLVPATATPGKATLYVLYNANKPPVALPFTVVLQTGKCP